MTANKISLALLGESNVGKSHYGAQLLSRVEAERCELRLREAPSDLSVFEEVREQLAAGLPGAHTPSGVYKESLWPIKDRRDNAVDLTWPDYAGEQVRQLIDTRRISADWLARVQEADGWILMVRPSLCKQDEDIFSRPLGSVSAPKDESTVAIRRSVQSRLVELLQMLRYARVLRDQRQPPALAVLLSCWDELGLQTGTKPADVLTERIPLLAAYVKTRWGDEHSMVFGLSALGTALSSTKSNEAFINEGPERHGFVVDADGSSDVDLTLPVARLAQMARR